MFWDSNNTAHRADGVNGAPESAPTWELLQELTSLWAMVALTVFSSPVSVFVTGPITALAHANTTAIVATTAGISPFKVFSSAFVPGRRKRGIFGFLRRWAGILLSRRSTRRSLSLRKTKALRMHHRLSQRQVRPSHW